MKFFKIPKLHLNSKECQEMFLESFILYSLKNYRFITKLFSLIVKNTFSVLDLYSFIPLVVAFYFFCF
ncbi:hypothetical protein HpNP49_14700 [Helicobacter pylori]